MRSLFGAVVDKAPLFVYKYRKTFMWYAIIAWDAPGSIEKRQQTRPAHLERLKQLQTEGRLLTAGPMPAIDTPTSTDAGYTGSLIIADFEHLEAAKIWANNDPYIAAGVYRETQVHPYKAVFPQ